MDVDTMLQIESNGSSDSESEEEIPAFSLASGSHASSEPRNKSLSKNDISMHPAASKQNITLSSVLDPGIDISEPYLSIFPHRDPESVRTKMKNLAMKTTVQELSKKSVVCQPGFEKIPHLSPFIEGRRKVRRQRIKERDKTAGPNWRNLPAPEMTETLKNDLMVLQMRSALDPKHFFKRGAFKILPKYFQVGTVVEHPADFYHSRIPKRQRKQTIVDELLADAQFRKYQKKKYAEILKDRPQKVYHSKKKTKKSKLIEARHSNSKPKKTKK